MKQEETNNTEISALPYVLFTVGSNTYGVSSEFVRSIETLTDVTAVTGSKPSVRGGLIYQGNFINLIDMRKLFSLHTQIEEFENAVNPTQRIKDHENWVNTLEKCVSDHTEFLLTDDPHMCALGKWYYSFETDNNDLRHQLSAIEAPHEAVHHTAKIVKKFMKENNFEAAKSTIEEMKNSHFKETINILSSLRKIVSSSLRELYIVIESGDRMAGIIIDSIVGIEYIEDTLKTPESMLNMHYIDFIGKQKDNSMVIILNNSIIS